ncbi:hypothetical protein K466DRAFT_584696 [Polyporus arcularius HHB13444]|uniref:Cytochrome P450 n=1 Tax=Polyporus arcularius HHB13444 TaxID=1314778 RepID=A0A5C3PJ26_9APHY|nr:hypothetical protein K466DRAFT_584696 [Polyporus arcularius HHB13444]
MKDVVIAYGDLIAKYGEVAYLDAFGQLILLGTHQTAVELLEKHLSNYSDRIFSSMVALTGWNFSLGVIRYGPQSRRR